MKSRNEGFTLIELLAVLVIAVLSLGLILPAVAAVRAKSTEEKCANNLRQIGQSIMLYASDNPRTPGMYPRLHYNAPAANIVDSSGQDLAVIANSANNPFTTESRDAAAGVGVGYNNIPAALFLLLRTQQITSDAFICPATAAKRDTFSRAGLQRQLTECGNFAKGSLSYGYASPYPNAAAIMKGFRLVLGGDPDMATMADLGPGVDGAEDNSYRTSRVTAEPSDLRFMNSNNHGKEGQNVLYADGHVEWKATPFVGVHHNHVYVPDTYKVGTTDDDMNRSWDGAARPGKPVTDPRLAKAIDVTDSVCLPWDD